MSNDDAPKDLLPVLVALANWFESQQTPYAIIGGVAVGFLGQARLTRDIDAVAWIDLSQAERYVSSAEQFGFFSRISHAISFAISSRMLLLRHANTNIDVDVSCGALPFKQELIERSIDFKTQQVLLKVASPEDLIITKAVAHRGRDLIDIDNLLDVYPKLDLTRVRYWVGEFAAVLEMPELIEDLEGLLRKRS